MWDDFSHSHVPQLVQPVTCKLAHAVFELKCSNPATADDLPTTLRNCYTGRQALVLRQAVPTLLAMATPLSV